jgi:hypothetical protein
MDWEWDSKFGHHGKSPLPLPLYHLICCETNMMVIKFILLFIPMFHKNQFQLLLFFSYFVQMKKINFIPKNNSKMLIFIIF